MKSPGTKTSAPIYVESHIACSIDELWARTQQPALHQRWDVRFTTIDYLDRTDASAPQQFVYATTVAPGLTVDGCGETLGERHRPDGTAYSGLRFWSENRLSLIESGSGYWRYVPHQDGGVRFLTRYDYVVRWGAFGRMVDRFVFRPLFGWGTAWSFDRLRLWIEQDLTPERALRQCIARAAVVSAAAALWLVGGFALLATTANGLPFEIAAAIGVAHISAGLGALRRWRRSALRNLLPSGRRPLRVRPVATQPASARPTTSRPAISQSAISQSASNRELQGTNQ